MGKTVVRVLLSLSVALNVVILGGAAWLAWGGGMSTVARSFLDAAHVRWVSQFELLPVERGDVVFLGDSITAGGSWHDLFPGIAVRNRGIGGDTTTGVLERLDSIVRGQPGKLFLKIGTNDLAFGRSPEEIAANVGEILQRVRRGSPDTQQYVQSVLPRAASWAESVEALNGLLEEVAQKNGATWIDLYPHFIDEGDRSIRDELSNDELHLLGPGYLLWRSRIEGYVRGAPGAGTGAAVDVELDTIDLGALAEVVANDAASWRLINVWATWCTPCLAELPLLVDLQRRYANGTLEVVTLSIDTAAQRDDALEVLSEIGASTRNLIVSDVETAKLAAVLDPEWLGPLPYSVLIAPRGGVAVRKQGAFGADELDGVIARELGG